jgi:hypothetical protein
MSGTFRDDPKHWRLRAEEARVCAKLIGDPESRRAMLEIADQYERIAKRTEETMTKKPAAPSVGSDELTKRKGDDPSNRIIEPPASRRALSVQRSGGGARVAAGTRTT